ncbi:alpha/beta hydrolase [Nocardioides lentus]|uniref:Alpha/beta hydrolase n=1 Tax=Nocardioides lentus TaxID=338077 RepID=A0ABN2PC23_9ACTN
MPATTTPAPQELRTHDGLRLAVRLDGPDSVDGRPPLTVVLAHCWTADREDWHHQVHDLLAAYGGRIRVLTWDARGHGDSDAAPTAACTIADLGRDLGDLLDAFAPTGRLVLAGHSIGGMTLMALAEQRPDLVERVDGVLFCATSSGGLDTVTLGIPGAGGTRVREQIPRLLATRARSLSRSKRRRTPLTERMIVRRYLFGDVKPPRDVGLVVDQIINCPPTTMEGFYRDLMGHERGPALAAYAGRPVTVVVGSADRLTAPRHARAIAAACPGARLLVAPGAGHMLTLERPRLVSTLLAELVDGAIAREALRR